MSYTVLGLYNSNEAASKAQRALTNNGFDQSSIDLSPASQSGEYTGADFDYDESQEETGFWDTSFGDDKETRDAYSTVGA